MKRIKLLIYRLELSSNIKIYNVVLVVFLKQYIESRDNLYKYY